MVTLFINGCGQSDFCGKNEVVRKVSPDSMVDAVVVKMDCGSTTDYSYHIFITPLGKIPKGSPVFIADKVDDISLVWGSSKELFIYYKNARIFNFTNFWQSKDVEDFKYTVSIFERKK